MTWSTVEVLLDRGQRDAAGDRPGGDPPRDAALRHRRANAADDRLRRRPARRPAFRHRLPTATSTCWPRPTGRSGRWSGHEARCRGRARSSTSLAARTWSPTTTSSTPSPRTTPSSRTRALSRTAAQAGQRRQGHAGRRRRLPGQQQRPADQAGRTRRSTATTTGRPGSGTRTASRHWRRSPASKQITVMGWFKMTGTRPEPQLDDRRPRPTGSTRSGSPACSRATPTATRCAPCWS